MKPGYKTTEFWAVATTSALTIANAALGWDIPAETIATLAAMVSAYAIGRGQAKKAQSPTGEPAP